MLRAVVEQHAEDAAFLWTMRHAATSASHTHLYDLERVDERLEAHLDGLKIAGSSGWKLCVEALSNGDFGEVFAASALAADAGSMPRINQIIEMAPSHDLARGLGDALGWVPFVKLGPLLRELCRSGSPKARAAALAAYAHHRQNPDNAVDRALLDDDAELRGSALRAIGELRISHRRAALEAALLDDHPENRFIAARSLSLLGDGAGVPILRAIALRGGELAEQSAMVVVMTVRQSEARSWIHELSRRPEHRRIAVRAAGVLGDLEALRLLLDWSSLPASTRIAADAITTLTGIAIHGDLVAHRDSPLAEADDDGGDLKDPIDDPDEDLPWPNLERLHAAVERVRSGYSPDRRYFLGRPLDRDALLEALVVGRQPERARAAFELSRMGESVLNVEAPFLRQKRALRALGLSTSLEGP